MRAPCRSDAEHAVLEREVGLRRDDMQAIALKRHAVAGLHHLHRGVAGQKLGHHALVGRIEMLDENEGKTGFCRQRCEQLSDGFQPAGRGAKTDHEKVIVNGRLDLFPHCGSGSLGLRPQALGLPRLFPRQGSFSRRLPPGAPGSSRLGHSPLHWLRGAASKRARRLRLSIFRGLSRARRRSILPPWDTRGNSPQPSVCGVASVTGRKRRIVNTENLLSSSCRDAGGGAHRPGHAGRGARSQTAGKEMKRPLT